MSHEQVAWGAHGQDTTVDQDLVKVRSEASALERPCANTAGKKASPAIEFVGRSKQAQQLLALVGRLAIARDAPVLLLGESGSGKDVVANLIHRMSRRREGPIICLNCTAIPESLMEAELFGYEKGAFTGATAGKKGLLELASGGTLFLDEIGDLPMALQPKLLRVLEGHPCRRVGGLTDVAVDLRVIGATHQDLRERIREGRFREDLFYRLDVVQIRIPPLRDRAEDIAPLVRYFLERLADQHQQKPAVVAPEAMAALERFHWPGNVRQLRNVIERALILRTGPTIGLRELPPEILPAALGQKGGAIDKDLSLDAAMRRHVSAVLELCGQNRTRAARLLRVSRSTLKAWLRAGRVGVKP